MTQESSTRDRIWPEAWAASVQVQIEAVERSRRIALNCAPSDARRTAVSDAVEASLAISRSAIRRPGRLPRGPLNRWRGVSVQQAYQSLHAARVQLVDLLPLEEVEALWPAVNARLAASLPPTDERRTVFQRLPAGDEPRMRAATKAAMNVGYEASDQLHTQIRGFRNVLLSTAVLILLLMVALVVIVWRTPWSMPLCFNPELTSASAAQTVTQTTVCPSGEASSGQGPSPGDVAIVAGLGLLGGALAAAFAIRKVRGTSNPYDVPVAVALLKVPSGALTAVVGILLLGGGFVPGLSELDSQRQVLAYALVFGYAQQLATRFIDDRAQSLLNAVPSKEPQAHQEPEPAPPQAPVPAPRSEQPAAEARTAVTQPAP